MTCLLAVDVGNTNTSIGVFEGDQLRCELRLETRRNWTRDEVAIMLERALALQGYGFAAISASSSARSRPASSRPWRTSRAGATSPPRAERGIAYDGRATHSDAP